MKLELKHLAPYLPYNLKLLGPNSYDAYNDIRDLKPTNINVVLDDLFGPQLKPILRPLSDLVKVINYNGKEFKTLDFIKDQCEDEYFTDTDFEEYIENRKHNTTYLTHAMDYLPYGLINRFIEWHFDVFGLIEKGLAIDINTL